MSYCSNTSLPRFATQLNLLVGLLNFAAQLICNPKKNPAKACLTNAPTHWLLVDVEAGVVREACRERGQIRLTFTAGTGEENKPRADDR